jgi:hypothetical protein
MLYYPLCGSLPRGRVLAVVFVVAALLSAASVMVLLLLPSLSGDSMRVTAGRRVGSTVQQQAPSDEARKNARLDIDALHLIPDDEIETVLMEFVWYKIGGDYEREYEVVSGLSPGLRMVYTTWTLEAEVNNGGFDQYFVNTDGTLALEALEGLRLLRAHKHAQLMENAIAIYARERPDLEKLRPVELSSGTMPYADFGSLDNAFYAIGPEENLRQMRLKYIRQHPDEFTGEGFVDDGR